MAPDDRSLSQAFMRSHPAQAARVLETLPAEAAAALFETTPARLAADVIAAMLPLKAARCLALLPEPRVLELLAPMPAQPTVALLRHVAEPRRRALIAGLPTASALASTLLLGYGEDTLGAWADPDILMLPADARAGDALARLRAAPVAHPVVFVTDAQRRLHGTVALMTLLAAPPAATLSTLMSRPAVALTAHAPLAGTVAHPGWERASTLPVLEPGGQLVGVMTRDALARALRRLEPPPAAPVESTLAGLAARGWWQAMSGLLGASLSLLPRVPRQAEPTGDER